MELESRMEFCHKKLSEQDGIREQGGLFQKKVEQAEWNFATENQE